MKTTIEMACEADCTYVDLTGDNAKSVERLKRFEALVRADEREETNRRANASWTLMCEKMVAAERELCAKVCEEQEELKGHTPFDCAAAIRARGNQ
jgi:hypothetical protein